MPRSDNPNYFAKLQKCHVCTEPCPQAELAREIGEDRLYKTQELIRLIKQIDSGELVPVVRCKDCKWYNNRMCYHPRFDYVCEIPPTMFDFDYCRYGERRNND